MRINIGIIGNGYVGNAVFQKFQQHYNMYVYDINSNLANSSLSNLKNNCKIIFICVPTPMNSDGSCNVSIVENILKNLNTSSNHIIVNKSTVYPGCTEIFNKKFKNLEIVSNPEFLTERNAVDDYNNQNRIILGGSKSTTTTLKNIFSKVFPKVRIIETGSTYAEMIKYFTNTFLATKVTFANEIYDLCSKLKLDYDKVVEYSVLDERIGNTHFNVPGHDGNFGFGGQCFPKDLLALIKLTDDLKTTNNLLKSLIKTNDIVRINEKTIN